MIKASTASPLSMTGLQAVIAHMRSKLRKPFDEAHVEMTLQPTLSRLKIVSLERSATGEYGKYAGETYLTYEKMPLGDALPNPLIYRDVYPTMFVRLRQWLWDTYGLVIEENEFALSTAPTVPLIDSSLINIPADTTNGQIQLVVLNTSGRFVAGGVLRLLLAPSNGPIWLPGLVPSAIQGNLNVLSYAA